MPKGHPAKSLCVIDNDPRVSNTRPAIVIVIVLAHWATTIPGLIAWREQLDTLLHTVIAAVSVQLLMSAALIFRRAWSHAASAARSAARAFVAACERVSQRVRVTGAITLQIGRC